MCKVLERGKNEIGVLRVEKGLNSAILERIDIFVNVRLTIEYRYKRVCRVRIDRDLIARWINVSTIQSNPRKNLLFLTLLLISHY